MDPLAVAGVALAIPAVLESCVKYIEHIHDMVERYRDTDNRFKELKFWIRVTWANIKIELTQVHNILEVTPTLPFEYRNNLEQLALDLKSQLKTLDERVESGCKGDVFGRAMFVLAGEARIEKTVAKLDKWHGLFHRHWKLVALHPSVAHELSLRQAQSQKGTAAFEDVRRICRAIRDVSAGTLPPELRIGADAIDAERALTWLEPDINDVKVVADAASPFAGCLFDDLAVPTPCSNLAEVERRTHELATLLAAVRADDVGILNCRGVFVAPLHGSAHIALLFELPRDAAPAPRALRSLLADGANARGARHALNDRLRLATQLARAVFFVHAAGLVHKNIRPESILMTEPHGAPRAARFPHALGTPFLVAFKQVRAETDASEQTSDALPARDLYRHPDRQGARARRKYDMLDDIYSLGVCLLEVALWRSFLRRDEGQHFVHDHSVINHLDHNGKMRPPDKIKEKFVKEARQQIPLIMGNAFSEVVIRCLTCWEGGFNDHNDPNGVLVGVKYIEVVLTTLESISY